MKFFIVVTIVMLVVMEIGANPMPDDEVQGQHAGALGRAKRATCDLFSALGVEDSLCAAHCLAMWFDGYRGGHCVDGVCVCRK